MKRKLVADGSAHGILVYAGKDPVGWCQYGPGDELPRTDHTRNYQRFSKAGDKVRLWRITCFVVDENYRGKGVASLGLKAALESIGKQGGGLVESYPVIETDQGSNYLCCGTVGMFSKEGFTIIGPYANGRTKTVIMRRGIRARDETT